MVNPAAVAGKGPADAVEIFQVVSRNSIRMGVGHYEKDGIFFR